MRIFVMDDIRCRRPDRDQMFWDSVCLDEILPEDHPARMVDRLEELRDEMAAHVAEVKDPAAMKPSRREREAQARLSRIDQALETLKALEEAKAKQKNKPSKQNPPQASTTDPEARMMRMGDGGMRPGYNVQIAVDIQSRAVVGAEVTSCGSDAQESARMRAQVNERTGQKVHRHLIDGGFVNLDQIEDGPRMPVVPLRSVPDWGVTRPGRIGTPLDRPTGRECALGVGAWATTVRRSSIDTTVETVNADAKEHRETVPRPRDPESPLRRIAGRAVLQPDSLWSEIDHVSLGKLITKDRENIAR
jgi:hypothetical protein